MFTAPKSSCGAADLSFSQHECARHCLTIFLLWTVLLGAAARRGSHEIWLFKAEPQSGYIDGLQLSYSNEPSQQPTRADAAVAARVCSRGPTNLERVYGAPRMQKFTCASLLYGECTDESHPRYYALPTLLSSILPPATMKLPKVAFWQGGSVHGACRRYGCHGHHPRAIQSWRMQQQGDHSWVCPRASPFCPKDTGIERRPGAKVCRKRQCLPAFGLSRPQAKQRTTWSLASSSRESQVSTKEHMGQINPLNALLPGGGRSELTSRLPVSSHRAQQPLGLLECS